VAIKRNRHQINGCPKGADDLLWLNWCRQSPLLSHARGKARQAPNKPKPNVHNHFGDTLFSSAWAQRDQEREEHPSTSINFADLQARCSYWICARYSGAKNRAIQAPTPPQDGAARQAKVAVGRGCAGCQRVGMEHLPRTTVIRPHAGRTTAQLTISGWNPASPASISLRNTCKNNPGTDR